MYPLEDTQKKLDKALKRNLETQKIGQKDLEQKPGETPSQLK